MVLGDRVPAALCSADALGRRADTNAATIVRQALGFDIRAAPLSRQAATVLLACDGAPPLGQSMTGMLSLSNVVVSRVIATTPVAARAQLERLDALFLDQRVPDD